MNITSLKQSVQDLERALEICHKNTESGVLKDACIYRFRNTYEITLRMIKRYLKETSSNPFEIEKLTFNQIIEEAFKASIIKLKVKDWKKFREYCIRMSEFYKEDEANEVLKEIPFFLEDVKHLISHLNESLPPEKEMTNKHDKPDIRPDHLKIVQDILNKSLSSDVKVWVYGSRAKWTTLDSSDLDLALESKNKIDDNIISGLKRDFEESNLPYEVDVVDINTVQLFFRDVINKDKVLLDRYAPIKDNYVVLQGEVKQNLWKKMLLKDVLLFSNGKNSPKRNQRHINPVYGSNGIIGFSEKTNSPPKTIIIGRVGSYCGSLYFSKKKCWVTDNAIKANAKLNHDPKFLFYLIQTLRLNDRQTGSGQPLLNQSILSSISVNIPKFSEQKAIAEILSSLDDKIEQNHNMNKILEEMAQSIFKSWFIDFDPVYAKRMALDAGLAEGQAERAAMAVIAGVCSPKEFVENFKQMDRRLNEKFSMINHNKRYEFIYKASLFPSEFVDSKLGPIPKGWNESNIGNEFNITMGQSPKGDTYNTSGEGVLFFQGRKDFDFRFPKERIFTSAPNRMAKAGDTLISVRAPVGDRNMAIKDCCVGRGLASLRHKSNNTTYTYYLISYIEKSLDGLGGSGTVFNSITKDTLSNIKIVAPSSSVIDKYDDMIKPFDDQIISLSIEISLLSNLRDILLPKLLSGEIDVFKIKPKEKL